MPKIKAYKGNGCLIPVELAQVATAYSCPATDKVFATKQAYSKHLLERRQSIHKKIARQKWFKKREELWNQPDFMSIIEWIHNNPSFMTENLIWHSGKLIENQILVEITYLELHYLKSVSNSHSCPRNGVCNWSGKPDFPRGYPGWSGRIEYKIHGKHSSFGSEIMRNLSIHTGTGGGTGNGLYGYDVKFFSSDWPGLEKSILMDLLTDTSVKGFGFGSKYYFL